MPSSPSCWRLLCPHLLLFLNLLLVSELAGCGPASFENTSGDESRASVNTPPFSKQGPEPGINPLTPVTPAASPWSLVSANGKGPVNGLAMPTGMTKELASPNGAVETWAQSAPPGTVDPLIQALNDKDERQVGPEARVEEEEYQDLDEEQANQDPDQGQANQDPDEKGEK